jgi:putative thioredoxin
MYVDVTDETFQTEVIARSADTPVVVDLWAPWCGPCKSLGPIIERVIAETNGAVLLAKVNVDENPKVSQAFQVQSIPAVFAISQGRVVEQFVGAIPEAQIREWVQRFAPTRTEADELADADDEASLRKALGLKHDHPLAVVKLARLLVENGSNHEALQLLERLPESAETRQIASLARVGVEARAGESDAIVGELAGLLPTVRADETAKQRYVDLLTVMGDDPRVPDLRRKLANALF